MRRLTRSSFCGALLAAGLLASAARAPTASSQATWAAESTYRFAGHYEGEWTAEVTVGPLDPGAAWPAVFEQRAGQVQGRVVVDLGCDGALSGEAQGQTRLPVAFTGIADGDTGPRVLTATLDVVSQDHFVGSLGARRADGPDGRIEAPLEGALGDLPTDLETAAVSTSIQRNYSGQAAQQWALLAGEPGRLTGSVDGVGELSLASGPLAPRLQLRSRGHWTAARVAQTLCPWRGSVVVSGAFGNQEIHEERLELSFRPTGDGRLEGEGVGEATIRGGPPGGCDYSGGGPFAVQVTGEERAGLFRLRLEDYDQPQLVITTTCAGGRFSAPQPTLSTLFGTIELPEATGAQAHATLPDTLADARGTLDVTISPLVGADPP